MRLPIGFQAIIPGLGLQRSDAVVVIDIQLAEMAGDFPGKDLRLRRGGRRAGALRQEHQQQYGRCGQPAQCGTETGMPLEEETDHRDQQQQIAGIGDAHAPGVMADRQDGALHILIEIRLVEPVTPVFVDMVHGNLHVFPGIPVNTDQLRSVIGRGFRTFIELHPELLQFQRKRQFRRPPVLQHIYGRRLAAAQVDLTGATPQEGHQGPEQDDRERQMQQKRKETFLHLADQHPAQAGNRQDRPQGDEQRVVVDDTEGRIGSLQPFKDRGSHHQHDEDCQRSICEIFYNRFLH